MLSTACEIDPKLVRTQLKATSIASQLPTITNNAMRNVVNKFTMFSKHFKDLSENVEPSKVVVIHPGSNFLKIGLASDAFPKIVPHVIAKPSTRKEYELNMEEYPENINEDDENNPIVDIEEILKLKLQAAKKRVPPNMHNQVLSFNAQAKPERIPDHNDSFKTEWLLPDSEAVFGDDVKHTSLLYSGVSCRSRKELQTLLPTA
jgi:hypothetical protein